MAAATERLTRDAYRAVGRFAPDVLWRRLARHSRRAGIDRPTFVLSLDCDTIKDIEVGPGVHERLQSLGITPVYAVPGELLERGADVYRAFAASGSELVNHGYVEHTRLEADGTYRSFFFYDELPRATVRDDVVRGHAAVTEVAGAPPKGFRTPHFGSFQSDDDLRFLHGVLAELGYEYSTSSSPIVAFRHGPVTSRWGIAEIPVTGCPTMPLGILDSFGFRFAPGRRFGPDDYVAEAAALATRLERGEPLLVNLYADPSQVHDWPGFFDAMHRFAPFAVRSYGEAIAACAR